MSIIRFFFGNFGKCATTNVHTELNKANLKTTHRATSQHVMNLSVSAQLSFKSVLCALC